MPIFIQIVGRTGDGKSALAKKLAAKLGHRGALPYQESASAESTIHHHGVVTVPIDDVVLSDTPGLMDSKGVQQDEANIRVIVEHARAQRQINAFILVVNEQAPRFDDGMQAAVKLLVDSFGPSVVSNMAVVFTRADGRKDASAARATAADFIALIAARTGLSASSIRIPHFQVECHPESFEGLMMPAAIDALRTRTDTALGDMLRWARALPPIDTSNAVIGEYEERKRQREAEAARAAEQQRREVEERARMEADQRATEARRVAEEQRRQAAAAEAQRDAAQAEAARQAQAAAAAEQARLETERRAAQEVAAANARAAEAERRAKKKDILRVLVPIIATALMAGAAAPAAAVAAHEASKSK